MTRFTPVEGAEERPDLAPVFAELAEYGFAPEGRPVSWVLQQTIKPAYLITNWEAWKSVVGRGDLPPTIKQMIYLIVSITDEDFEELRVHGFSDGEILEAVLTAALARVANIWADVGGLTPEPASQ